MTAAAEPDWRILEPEALVLMVAGILLTANVEDPSRKVYVQAELEARGILADHLDVYNAVAKLRRRYRWEVDAVEGRPGYRLVRWPFHFTRRPRLQLTLWRPR